MYKSTYFPDGAFSLVGSWWELHPLLYNPIHSLFINTWSNQVGDYVMTLLWCWVHSLIHLSITVWPATLKSSRECNWSLFSTNHVSRSFQEWHIQIQSLLYVMKFLYQVCLYCNRDMQWYHNIPIRWLVFQIWT